MATILVHVMPKPEILDPQGKAVGSALARLGFTDVDQVRQGKRFEITVDGEVTDEVLAKVREAAETVLSNPVIEDVVQVKVVGSGCGCGGHGGHSGGHHNGAGLTKKDPKDLLA
jgi:phosphoribosylformylglycinamidine synthase PurS subunit